MFYWTGGWVIGDHGMLQIAWLHVSPEGSSSVARALGGSFWAHSGWETSFTMDEVQESGGDFVSAARRVQGHWNSWWNARSEGAPVAKRWICNQVVKEEPILVLMGFIGIPLRVSSRMEVSSLLWPQYSTIHVLLWSCLDIRSQFSSEWWWFHVSSHVQPGFGSRFVTVPLAGVGAPLEVLLQSARRSLWVWGSTSGSSCFCAIKNGIYSEGAKIVLGV